jgi:hypothetical protein
MHPPHALAPIGSRSLAPLLAALLAGCADDDKSTTTASTDIPNPTVTESTTGQCTLDAPEDEHLIFELTPAEYESWSMGVPPDATTGDPTSSGTSSGSSTGSEPLDDDAICRKVCAWNTHGVKESWDLSSCTIEPDGANYKVDCVYPGACPGDRLPAPEHLDR